MRTLLTLVTAALLAVGAPAAAVALPLQPTAGLPGSGLGVRLIDPPGNQIDVTLEPGDTFTGRVRITNDIGVARDISVYAGSASMVNGGFDADPLGETNALTAWTSVDTPTVHLNNGQSTEVAVTIKVPANAPSAALQAILWARVDSTMLGVRMDVKVGGSNGPAADFSVTDLTPQRRPDGTAVVAASVTNIGTRTIDLTGTLRLTAVSGVQRIDAVPEHPTTLAAGATGTVLFVVPDSVSLSNGPWLANARLKNGYFTHEKEKTVTFPDKSPDNPSPPSSGSLGSLGFGSLGSSS